MSRTARIAPGGMVFHVLNRGVGRMEVFRAEKDPDCVARYVERNALWAGLVGRAENWKRESLHQRAGKRRGPLLTEWPLPEPSD